jgi:glycosyltransferase involved in cell wall biosynthesis
MVRELTVGGCERDLTKLAKHLDREQYTPYVGCFLPDGVRADELREAGIPIVVFPVRSFYGFSTLRAARMMRKFLRERQIQVVHPFDVPTDIFAVPVAHFCRVPVVLSCQLSFRNMYTPIYRRALKWTDPLADRIVVNSEAVRQSLITGEGLPPKRVSLCYNGVDTAIFSPPPDPRPASAPLVIGSLCVLREEKRLDLLLSAFAKIRHLRAGMKLLIVGSGPMLEPLEAQSRELGILDVCQFEPARSDVAPWLRRMDIFVTSSRSESFPNALLEAMACGCAPIGSNVGGIPELIEHGRTGLLFESGSVDGLSAQLEQLVASDPRRKSLAAAAAERARTRFSMQVNVQTNQRIYREILETKGSARRV